VRAPGDPGSRERHSGPLNGGNFNAKGVYRRMIADNGKDMTPEELGEFFNCFGGGGKAIGDEHENFGIGAKTALEPSWRRCNLLGRRPARYDPHHARRDDG
jgi:hypothetical protein